MSLGVVILVLGLLYLLIVSPRFRRVSAIILAILVAAVLVVVLGYRRNEASLQHKREMAKTYIKPNQIELVDPRVSFSTYDGRPERLTARIRNNSSYTLESVEVRLIFKDCSPQNRCETVGDEKNQINVDVPFGQSRDFIEYLSGRAVSPKGQITWTYEILSVSAHID